MVNVNLREGKISTKFKLSQSCQDIDQSREDTILYQIKVPSDYQDNKNEYKLQELVFMKSYKTGKGFCGTTLHKVLPRLEYLKASTTMIELKRYIFSKISYIFKEGLSRF